ncbi:MAG: M15 family metallopeptidase, partial [Saprospiraceae bacterium]
MIKVNAFRNFLLFGLLFLLSSCNSSESSVANNEAPVIAKATLVNADSSIKKAITQKQMIRHDSSISTEYLMGKFDPAKHPDFALLSKEHASGDGMYLRKATYEQFKKMAAAAKKDGVTFIIKSATRNFARQKVIWEGKWNGTRLLEGGLNAKKLFPDPNKRAFKILEYSSMPGTSRHHWGTDFDVNNFTNAYFEKGKGLKEYEWLVAHAQEYGFCQPYTPKGKERPDGYNEEKWHWSYLPIAVPLIEQYQLRIP